MGVHYGVKYQFGSTPGVVYQDVRFTPKTLLNLRHNQNLPSWVAFSDLVTPFDTSNQKIPIAILSRYEAPLSFCSAIRIRYENSVVRLKIGEIDTSIPFKVVFKQGDSMVPVIFLFLIMEFSDTLKKEMDKEWTHKSRILKTEQLTSLYRPYYHPQTKILQLRESIQNILRAIRRQWNICI